MKNELGAVIPYHSIDRVLDLVRKKEEREAKGGGIVGKETLFESGQGYLSFQNGVERIITQEPTESRDDGAAERVDKQVASKDLSIHFDLEQWVQVLVTQKNRPTHMFHGCKKDHDQNASEKTALQGRRFVRVARFGGCVGLQRQK